MSAGSRSGSRAGESPGASSAPRGSGWYPILSALSGCVWAIVAWVLGHESFPRTIAGGLIATPLIGLLIGQLYRPAYRFPAIGQVFAALVSLYVAAALFGLAVGMYDALVSGSAGRNRPEVVTQAMLGTLWGVTFTGYVILLWPLAYLNHRILRPALGSAALAVGLAMFAIAMPLAVTAPAAATPVVTPESVPTDSHPDSAAVDTSLAGPELIPLATLLGPEDFTAVGLSPDGTLLSFIAPLDGVPNLWVAPADDPGAARPLTEEKSRGLQAFDASGNVNYRWSADGSRLLFVKDRDGDENWQLYSVEVGSGDLHALTDFANAEVRILSLSLDRPDQVLIGANDGDPAHRDVYRVDLHTGERTLVLKNEGFAGIIADNALEPRLGITVTPEGEFLVFRRQVPPDTAGGEWLEFDHVKSEDTHNRSIGFDRANRVLYSLSSAGRNTMALVAREMSTGRITVLAADDSVDVGTVLRNPVTLEIDAYSTNRVRRQWHAIAPEVASDLEALARREPGDFTIEGRSRDDRRWLVRYVRDDAPASWALYDRPSRTTRALFSESAAIAALPLARTRPVVTRSRDGLTLVSYLTLPRGTDPDENGIPAEPLPMVLIVHGGPGDERAEYGFSPLLQWLANRGYAVFNVNFRGSPGFGKAFLNAERLEWGGKMQDDLIDQVRWAIRRKIARKDRIAILGGSYGGYAALCGMTFTPDVFACGVDVVGPANLETFMATIPPHWSLDHFAKRVGDPRTPAGRKLLAARSPIHAVGRVRHPLLIAQGANDPRVPKAESDRMVAALEAKRVPVTYLVYPDEGHGFVRPENANAFYAITEAFLSRHLGGRCLPLGDALEGSSVEVPNGAGGISGLAEALQRRRSNGIDSSVEPK